MKTKIYSIEGKEKGTIELPKIFESKIREDIVAKVLEVKKMKQPFSPDLLAGMKQSAKGKIRHRRHVWQTHYGRGMSRIPRKVMWRRGTQFSWEGAEVPFAKGGKRAHPPKVISMINTLKINKKEMERAFESAIAATAKAEMIVKKYSRVKEHPKNLPFVIESKSDSAKSKTMLNAVKEMLGNEISKVAVQSRSIRAGVGKLRGRKYKKNAGALIVRGSKEKLKTNAFEIKSVNELGVEDLARGGLGRITIYTENAIKELGERK